MAAVDPPVPLAPSVSVIVPVLHDAARLDRLLARLPGRSRCELVVANGDAGDAAVGRMRGARPDVVWVESEPGRGRQMNAGAATATGDVLLFLHADTLLPINFLEHIDKLLSREGTSAGAFRLGVDGPGRMLRWVENMANWRSLYCQLPYGDQAIFVKAETFRRAGGFAEIPLMEDFELMRRLRKLGRIELAPVAVRTSARRWRQLGVLRATWSNQLCLLAYLIGISPCRIAAWRDAHGD